MFCSVIFSFWEYSSFDFILEVDKSVDIEIGKTVDESIDGAGGILL